MPTALNGLTVLGCGVFLKRFGEQVQIQVHKHGRDEPGVQLRKELVLVGQLQAAFEEIAPEAIDPTLSLTEELNAEQQAELFKLRGDVRHFAENAQILKDRHTEELRAKNSVIEHMQGKARNLKDKHKAEIQAVEDQLSGLSVRTKALESKLGLLVAAQEEE